MFRQEPLPFLDDRAEALGDPGLLEEVKVERELQLVVIAVVTDVPAEVPHADLADRHAIAVVRVEDLPPAAVDVVHLVEIPVPSPRPAAQLEARVVAQAFVSDQPRCHVDAEPVDAAIEPKAHHVVDRGADVFVPPVEIGLLRQEMVQVVLAGLFVERPRAADALEHGAPVVRRPAAATRFGPDIEVALRIGARGARRDEPGVLVRGVARDEIDDDADAAAMRFREESVELVELPEGRVDVAVVRNVVTEVGHRRAIERREPDRVDAE